MEPGQKSFRTFEDLEAILYLRDRKAGASLALHESSPAYGLTDEELGATLKEQPLPDLTIQRFNER